MTGSLSQLLPGQSERGPIQFGGWSKSNYYCDFFFTYGNLALVKVQWQLPGIEPLLDSLETVLKSVRIS